MSLSRIVVERPVGIILMIAGLLILGLAGMSMMPISALPEVDYPTIEVRTFYPGASADVVTGAITSPLEHRLGEIPGLTEMSSTSSNGASVITLQFSLSTPIDVAGQDVQAAINVASNLLPADLPGPPVYAKVNPADTPVILLALSSTALPLAQLHDLAEQRVSPRLSRLPGIGLVTTSGGGRSAIRVRFRPSALAAANLHADDLRTTLANLNVNTPKGGFDGPARAHAINANDQLTDAQSFRDQVIAWRAGATVRLSDVATVTEDVENTDLGAWTNGKPSVVLSVRRQPGANVISAVDRIRAALPEISADLPPAVELTVMGDRTRTIRASVMDAAFELSIAVALVVAVMFVFLRTPAATFIPSISVPLSIVGTFAAMYAFGFSINNLTLMALTIGAGFVVDDAIVVVENIARHAEGGMSKRDAAVAGTRQIGFTVLSLTVSLIAVLIPLLFMADVVGRLFHEFAITLAAGVVISAVVALTLVPTLCARLSLSLPGPGRQGRVMAAYGRALDWVLDHAGLTMATTALALGATTVLYVQAPKGLFPVQDTGLLEVVTRAPAGISFVAMAERQQLVAGNLLQDPAVESVASFIGVDGTNPTLNQGRIAVTLRPRAERDDDARAVANRLIATAAGIAGMTVQAAPVQDLTVDASVGTAGYHIAVTAPRSVALLAWVPAFVERLRAQPALTDVESNLDAGARELFVRLDRPNAARLGITPATVDNALYDAFGQRVVSTIFTATNQHRVILEADRRPVAGDLPLGNVPLGDVFLPSELVPGGQVPLRSVANVTLRPALSQIGHLGQYPAATISFNLAEGTSLAAAADAIRTATAESAPAPDIHVIPQGTLRALDGVLDGQLLLILAALVTMYIVLGVLYESFIHPLTILSTLPSAGLGALLALRIADRPLDIVGIIGMVLLIGIVKKNAIMMIDFALDARRARGLPARLAIREAALKRIRPILMTTCAALFAALPLLLATGDGAELRRPLGIALIGGLLVSQMLTVFTTPVVYMVFERLTAGPGKRAPG
jgi:multidrug efflux pump